MADEKEAKSGNSGLDVYLDSAEKNERSGEKVWKTVGLVAAGAALMPLASSKVVVLGRKIFFACVFAVFNIIRQVFGGVF